MYGGLLNTATEAAADLWRFNMTSGFWCFLGGTTDRPWAGSSYTDSLYSPKYAPASAGAPALFIDSDGDLWLFGGVSSAGYSAALWTYSMRQKMFARVTGSPNTWSTNARSSPAWPHSVARFGYFQSSLGSSSHMNIRPANPLID